jgi:hypothetical protein
MSRLRTARHKRYKEMSGFDILVEYSAGRAGVVLMVS